MGSCRDDQRKDRAQHGAPVNIRSFLHSIEERWLKQGFEPLCGRTMLTDVKLAAGEYVDKVEQVQVTGSAEIEFHPEPSGDHILRQVIDAVHVSDIDPAIKEADPGHAHVVELEPDPVPLFQP